MRALLLCFVTALQAVLVGCASTSPAEGAARAPRPAHVYLVEQVAASALPPTEARRPHFVTCDPCAPRTPKTLASRALVSDPGEAQGAKVASLPVERTAPAAEPAKATRAWRALVYFPFASDRLSPSAEQALESLEPVLLRASTVRITGYTDDIGPPGANARLATARAESVLRALLALRGDGLRRAEHQGRPLCCYIAPNDAEFTRARNRRVELVFTVASDPQTDAALKRAAQQIDLLFAKGDADARAFLNPSPQ